MGDLFDQLLKLTPAERIQLAEDLWDSVGQGSLPPLTDLQRVEVERRLADHNADPASAASWDLVCARLRSRLG